MHEEKTPLANGRNRVVPNPLRMLWSAGVLGAESDGQLLERYLGRRDEAAELAFAALVERHGPMVLRVCRGVLRDAHDSEDAFQATFLVLARRAGSIRTRSSVGSWLHGVAARVASASRAARQRRRVHEERAGQGSPTVCDVVEPSDLAPLLDEEIRALPEKFRAPIVTCYMQGLTHEQAAARLGWPVGTVRSRLARGRERLQNRLVRRGIAPSVAFRAATLTQDTVPQSVSARLVAAAARAAVELDRARSLSSLLADMAGGWFGMGSTKFAVTGSLLILIAFGAVKAGRGTTDAAGNPGDGPRPSPQVAVPASQRMIELPARTAYDPDKLAKIGPRFDALVRRVRTSVGERVKKGAPLVEVQSKVLADAKHALVAAHVELLDAQRRVRIFSRLEATQRDDDARRKRIDAQKEAERGSLAYQLSRDKLRVYQVPDEEIDRLINNKVPIPQVEQAWMTLIAPIDGLVIETATHPGEFCHANDVMMVIAPLDQLLVWAEVPARHRNRLDVGGRVEIRSPLLETPITGAVRSVTDMGPKSSGRARVCVAIANPDRRLIGGIPVQIRLPAD